MVAAATLATALTVPSRTLDEIASAATAAPPQAGRAPGILLQDYTPLATCLEAELSGHYWRKAGIGGFACNAVPFIVNNNGRLSECAAQVLFGHCLETGSQGSIELLELGAGSGLFALYFLDAFRAVCERQGRSDYARIRYHVTDGSSETVAAWLRQGQFAGHADRVVLATCDALHPGALIGLDGSPVALQPLTAIFANYLLDSLPAAIVRQGPSGPEQLCIRTSLPAPPELDALLPGTCGEDLARLAASCDPAMRAELLPSLDLFEIQARFEPLRESLPFLATALALAEPGARTILNHGALGCLGQCASLLGEGGFLLVSDYGPVAPAEMAGHASPSRFGRSSALGVNFPVLDAVATEAGLVATAPDGDATLPVHVRLFAPSPLPLVRATMADRFSQRTSNILDAPAERARRCAVLGDIPGALAAYGVALGLNRQNWTMMAEMARFMLDNGLEGAADVARHAVRTNPWYASSLWVLLGDALFKADDMAGARIAFEQALQLDPADNLACLGLSYVHAAEGRLRDAADLAVTALLADRTGSARDGLIAHLGNIAAVAVAKAGQSELRTLRRTEALQTAADPP